MIHLLSPIRIISMIAVTYAAVAIFILLKWTDPKASPLQNAASAFSGSTVLTGILLAFIYFAWRGLWWMVPPLNRVVFPDLNGIWDMTISWNWNENSGQTKAVAHIKQDFLKLSMEVDSLGSESETLLAKPKKDPESGRPTLYYLYRTFPKQSHGKSDAPYDGAAILKLDHSDLNTLSGNYFTNRSSFGRFVLVKREG